MSNDRYERIRAALVAAAEREECAKVCEYREMYGDLIETLRDCTNALDELLPRDHAYRKIVEQANRLIDRHDCRTTQDVNADASFIAACGPDTIRALLEERDVLVAAKVASYERAERK